MTRLIAQHDRNVLEAIDAKGRMIPIYTDFAAHLRDKREVLTIYDLSLFRGETRSVFAIGSPVPGRGRDSMFYAENPLRHNARHIRAAFKAAGFPVPVVRGPFAYLTRHLMRLAPSYTSFQLK